MAKSKTIVPGGVDEYIAACPKEVQAKLSQIRQAIREVAPDATETVSYFKFPGYGYLDQGYDYSGMFAWFSYKKPYIRLHVRPPVVADHKRQFKENYLMNVGAVSIPKHENISTALVKKLVEASLQVMKDKIKKA
jgi:uncharacterized protein YdhG (YjbR/CyaY superfamily)